MNEICEHKNSPQYCPECHPKPELSKCEWCIDLSKEAAADCDCQLEPGKEIKYKAPQEDSWEKEFDKLIIVEKPQDGRKIVKIWCEMDKDSETTTNKIYTNGEKQTLKSFIKSLINKEWEKFENWGHEDCAVKIAQARHDAFKECINEIEKVDNDVIGKRYLLKTFSSLSQKSHE